MSMSIKQTKEEMQTIVGLIESMEIAEDENKRRLLAGAVCARLDELSWSLGCTKAELRNLEAADDKWPEHKPDWEVEA